MATNLTIETGEDAVTLFYRDGTTKTVEPNSTETVELIDDYAVTITDINVAEKAKEIAEKIRNFWQAIRDQVPPMPSRPQPKR